jgi:hypothetical protein
MKAEPESRLEKGHDIKFSIDNLASKSEPEAWDGKLPPQPKSNNLVANDQLQASEHIQVIHIFGIHY